MAEAQLQDLINHLSQTGIDVGSLKMLHQELETIEHPTLFSKVKGNLTAAVKRQWGHVVGEVSESRQMMVLLQTKIQGKVELSAAERDSIKSQLTDLLRLVPASMIAATNSILPIPGTSLLTPWLLNRMGLLPSRWREAHILNGLKKRRLELSQSGMDAAATKIEEIEHQIEEEADRRSALEEQSALLPWWDTNNNGIWDEDEVAAYQIELDKLIALAIRHASSLRWFYLYEQQVFGPLRISQLKGIDSQISLLICFDGKSGWVKYSDLLAGMP
jgi:hypothetical protein